MAEILEIPRQPGEPWVVEAARKLKKIRDPGNLKSSLEYGLTQNPDAAAKNQANAQQYSLPLSTVEQEPELVDKAVRRKEIIKKLQGTQILKTMMKDARFAAVANDDIDELKRVEESITPVDYLKGIGTEYAVGSALAFEGIKGQWWGLVEALQGAVNPDPEIMEKFRRKEMKSITDYRVAQEVLAEARPNFETEEATAFYSGVASFARQAPGLMMGLVGGPAAGLSYMGIMTEAEAYLKYRERGGTRGEALTGAMLEGGIEVLTEKIPMDFFVAKFGKSGMMEFFGRLLAREMPTEVAATIGQELVDTIIANPERTLEDYKHDITRLDQGNILYHTLIATLAHAGLAGTLNIPATMAANRYGGGMDRAQTALDERALLDNQVVVAQESKLRSRSPEQFKHFIEKQLGSENAVYLSPEDAEAFFQSHPEIMEVLPEDTRAGITESLRAGLDVSIPKSEYLTHFTDFHEEIADVLRNDIDGMTTAEANRWAQDNEQEFESAAEDILAEMDQESEFVEQITQYEQGMVDQLERAGRDPEYARKAAQLPKAFITVIAQKMGITPNELITRFPQLGLQVQTTALPDVEGLSQTEQTEYQQAVAKGLDMSEEARMERAKEMGFDTDTVYYVSVLQDTEQFDATGRFMGYSGTSGISVTDSPEMAARYLDRYGNFDYKQRPFSKNTIPVYIKKGNMLDVEKSPYQSPVPMGFPLPDGYINPLIADGYDSMRVPDSISRKGGVKHSDAKNAIRGHEIILVDPSQIRSINAAFDPDFQDSGNLLAQGPIPEIEARFVEKLGLEQLSAEEFQIIDEAKFTAAIEEYATLEESEGGKVINTDTARELSPDYLADRTLSASVHEPASFFVKELYRRKLQETPREGENDLVLFTAGGTGAGKSSALKVVPKTSHLKEESQIVFDTNMNTLNSARNKVQQALDADKAVVISLVVRDPVDALVNGAFPRAERQIAEHDSGRTVPLNEHLKTHEGAPDVVETLAEEFKDNPLVEIIAIDNTRGKGKAAEVELENIPKFDYTDTWNHLLAAREEAYAEGKISRQTYEGFAPAEIPAGPEGVGQASREGDGRQYQPGIQEALAQSPLPVFETGTEPVPPGQPFLVARIGSGRTDLTNSNAGNLQGVARHIQRQQDFDAPSTRRAMGDTINIFQVTSPAFGKYQAMNARETREGGAVGRQVEGDQISYSFPTGAEYTTTPIATISYSEVETILNRMGYADMDESGTSLGTEALQEAVQQHLSLQQQNRGQIQFTDEGSLITLLENADLSTFLHESGHFFFEAYKTLALENDAIRADMGVLLDFIGVDSLETWNTLSLDQRREGHEKVARAFEAYLFEGKSPSLEMQSLFDTFRSWLVQVYKNLRNLNISLTDDVRQVFDRMLASEDLIREREVADNYQALFRSNEEGEMTEKQWLEYQNLNAAQQNASVGALTRRSLSDLKWVSNKIASLIRASESDIRTKRKVMKAEVTAELESSPVYQVIKFVKTGEFVDLDGNSQKSPQHKLDRDAFYAQYPNYKLPRGWTEKEGIMPEELAEQFGFGSGNEMMEQMLSAAPLKKQIERVTDQRMLETYGDLNNPAKIQQAAEEAVHSDAHTRMLHTELTHLRKRTGVGNLLHKAAKALAERTINAMKVARIKPWQYSRAEARAARESERALIKGDRESAAEHKRAQILQNHFFRAANHAAKQVESTHTYLKKFDRPGVRKNLDREYLDQIDTLLEKVGLKKISQKEVERRKAFSEWYEAHESEGVEVPKDYAERLKTHYTDMTFEQLMGLRDNIKNIEHLARLKHKLKVGQEVRDYNETMDQAHDLALQQNPQKYDPTDRAPKKFRGLRRFFSKLRAMHIKVEFLAEQLDGDKENGLWWNLLFRPLAEAEDVELNMQDEVSVKLGEILKAEAFKHLDRKIYINQKAGHYDWNQVFSMALNWGNEGNRIALVQGLESQGLTHDEVQRILNENLTEADWNTVQQIWDLIDSYWPQIAELQKNLTGVVPEKVERSAVETPFGSIEGGYYPLVYDTEYSYKAFTRDQKLSVEELLETNFLRPATRKGHTIERVGSAGQPVKLDIGVISTHINNVIHDLAFREAILNTDKVIQDRRTADAVERIAGKEAYRMLRPWLASVANAHRPIVDPGEMAARYFRKNATIVNMGMKLTTAIVQPLGYTQSIDILGEKWAMHGLAQFYGNPLKAKALIDDVFGKSTFMRNRIGTFDRDINDAIRRVKKESGPITKMQQWAFKHIGFMDLSISIPTWKAGYDKALSEGMSEKDAIAQGDKVVRMSQSAGAAKDLARIQAGGEKYSEYLKTLTMFYSYFSSMYNMMRRRRNISGRQPISAGKVARNTMSFLYLVALPAVLSELIVGRGPDEDEDEEWTEWIAKETLAYPLMSIVGVRDFTNAIVRGYGYQITPIAQGLEILTTVPESTFDIVTGEGEESDFKNMTMASGYLFGLPARQLWTIIDNSMALADGERLTGPELMMLREQRE